MTLMARLLILVPLLVLLAGCASQDARKREYYNAQEVAPLQIPEGLSGPSAATALVISIPPVPLSPMSMETRPPRISSTTSGLDANSAFSWSPEGLYLMVDDSPESVHRRLGLVIERAGMQRIRIDEKGVYRFDYYQKDDEEEGGFFSSLAFWRHHKGEDYSGAYQTFTQPDSGSEKTRVYIKYADGTDCEPDAAEHLLDVIRSRLG